MKTPDCKTCWKRHLCIFACVPVNDLLAAIDYAFELIEVR